MIDLAQAREYFRKYTDRYDSNTARIRLKIEHIERVAENSRKIARMIELQAEDQDLAELIGLLHDIGRFEQVKLYNTFNDRESIDHADKGVEVLFQGGEIRNFIATGQYDQVIAKAVKNHNKFQIESGLSEREELFCKIIRDADKLDIFPTFLTEKLEDVVHMESEDVAAEILSPEFYQAFHGEHPLKFAECKTNMDFLVCILAFVYDFNFNETLTLVGEQDYIRRIVKRIDAKDPQTREWLDEIGDYATKYIKNKISARS